MVGKPFEKGKSGNPGGRPKADPDVTALARQASPRAIKRLAELISSKDLRAAIAASNAILDRAYGKPPQSMEMSGKDGAPLPPFQVIVIASDAEATS